MRILIVGAGIAGLGAARALRRRGFTTDVVERQLAWKHPGAGIYLPGNAARALRGLGVESAVVERSRVITRQRFCDHRGRLLVDIDLPALWGDVGQCLAVHREDLHEILASHGDPVPVRMGVGVRALSQPDKDVTVEFDDGIVGSYDLVVGADGVHSTVRELVVGGGRTRPVGYHAWRFVTECPSDVTTWTVLLGRGVTFLAVPIGRDQVYCYCDAPVDRGPRLSDEDMIGRLAELLAGFSAPVPALLNSVSGAGDVHLAPIEEARLDDWSHGSVLLIGDAAHATSPNMAEGAAMALEDGMVLADCLAAGGGGPAAMSDFETRRRRRTQWVLTQTHRRDRTRALPPPIRNLVLRNWGRQIFQANYRPLLSAP